MTRLKKNQGNRDVYNEKLSKYRKYGEPILKFGFPKAEDEDDDEESPDLSSLLNRKNPFSTISSNLYNIDYNNRIIVINEEIDERCFVYAKMIENWNRIDKKALDLKAKFKDLLEKDPDVGLLLGLTEVKTEEEAQAKYNELVAKHPILTSLLGTLRELEISSSNLLNYEAIPIKIKFNSPGGWIVAYQTLSDVISLSKTKVIGINMGMAYSAAAFLLIACHERFALPKARMMIHRGSSVNSGTFEQTESSQQNYREEVDEMIAAFRKRTKIPEGVLKEKMAPDWYFSAKMALKYGIIDRIVTDINEIL